MRITLAFVVCLFGVLPFAQAQPTSLHRPPNFYSSEVGGTTVFVDFVRSVHRFDHDLATGYATTTSDITFNSMEPGYPVFVLTDDPASIEIDGIRGDSKTVKPSADSRNLRALTVPVEPGRHTLHIVHRKHYSRLRLPNGEFTDIFFQMYDYNEGQYLEKYLPTNLEYDQYQATMFVSLLNTSEDHAIFTNGTVTRNGPFFWQIDFPSFFNASSFYFHLLSSSFAESLEFDADDGIGGQIPVTLYRRKDLYLRGDLNDLKNVAESALENQGLRFGRFPYPRLLVHAGGRGGMEYAGAVQANAGSLEHEIAHSYFGRGVFPADGNAGWIDEAIATYIETNTLPAPLPVTPFHAAGHSPYYDGNDFAGYSAGFNFLLYLQASHFIDMDRFLRSWAQSRMFSTITTEDFQRDLEAFSGRDLGDDFRQFVY